jgi:hypothetical protein
MGVMWRGEIAGFMKFVKKRSILNDTCGSGGGRHGAGVTARHAFPPRLVRRVVHVFAVN